MVLINIKSRLNKVERASEIKGSSNLRHVIERLNNAELKTLYEAAMAANKGVELTAEEAEILNRVTGEAVDTV